MKWTKEQDTEAAKLWAAGISASEIAKHIGVNRGAVIGRMYRLGVQTPTAEGGKRKDAPTIPLGTPKLKPPRDGVPDPRNGCMTPHIVRRPKSMTDAELARLAELQRAAAARWAERRAMLAKLFRNDGAVHKPPWNPLTDAKPNFLQRKTKGNRTCESSQPTNVLPKSISRKS